MITGIVTVEGVVEDGAGAKADTRDRERGKGEGERSVTYLHVIGRESDSITRSNRRSFPLKCAFFFISVTLIFYLSPPLCHASSRSLNIHIP